MSIASIVTRGFLDNLISTRGYVSGAAPTPTPSVELLGGGPGYERRYASYEENRALAEKAVAHNVSALRTKLNENDELATAEQLRLDEIEAKKAQRMAKKAAKELAALEASLREEINRLRMERVWLMRKIDDEEAILVILLSLPLH